MVGNWLELAQSAPLNASFYPQAFWRTLALDSTIEESRDKAPETWYDMSLPAIEDSLSKSDHCPAEYLTTLTFTARLRQFAISAEGRYLMVPFEATKGDAVCVILGCDIPVVLKVLEKKWSFVGECYCWGANGWGSLRY
jgi:hypothetical protein